MSELPDNVENTVLHVETGASGLPLRDIKIGHLGTRRESRRRTDLLMNSTQNTVVNLQAKGVDAGLFLKERRRR